MVGPKGTSQFKQIIRGDHYGIRGYSRDSFNFIFDIGASVGFFSVQARILFPDATVVAVEPAEEILPHLYENVNMLNIKVEPCAIGNGSIGYLGKRGHPLDSLLVPDFQDDVQKVQTISLRTLLKKYGCGFNDDYLLKINCEGGEKFFIGDKKAESILKNAKQINMMIHFQSPLTPFTHWLTLKEYQDWFYNLLYNTHSIDFYGCNLQKGRSFFRAIRDKVIQTADERKMVYINNPSDLYMERFIKVKVQKNHKYIKCGKIIAETFGVKSAVDFGCCLGAYLEGMLLAGVKDILGFDILFDRVKRYIPKRLLSCIRYGNVGRHIYCGKKDCALSIETAEHLLPEEADVFVDNLVTAAGRLIIVTASDKHGYYHLNPQPKKYWIDKFEKKNARFSLEKTEQLQQALMYNSPRYIRRNLMVFDIL